MNIKAIFGTVVILSLLVLWIYGIAMFFAVKVISAILILGVWAVGIYMMISDYLEGRAK